MVWGEGGRRREGTKTYGIVNVGADDETLSPAGLVGDGDDVTGLFASCAMAHRKKTQTICQMKLSR